jgi:acyl-CoA synthetase (NDP forming)
MKPFANLDLLVAPRNVAIVGASSRESSQGRRLFDNIVLHSSFAGLVFPVNPAYSEIGDRQCWPSVESLPDVEIDVALIIIKASLVLNTLEQCARRGIPFAIVMTSGFAEAGSAGKALEAEIAALCARTSLRVYGPNCPGFVNLRDKLGLTFSPAFKSDLNAGPIGLATQGGGLGRNVLQGLAQGPGVGIWFSAGNEADLALPDFIAHMAVDADIKVIAVLMEGIKDGARFARALQLARENRKPVVVLKIGRSEEGVRAAQSHTASVAGSAAVNSAAFRQFGAIEVEDLDELVALSRMLVYPLPKRGAGLCIYTFSGGTAALAADIAGASAVPLARLSPDTIAALRGLLPAFANVENPIDTTADVLRDVSASSECLRIVCRDEHVGIVLCPIPMDYGDITETMAQTITEAAATFDKAIVPVWMSRRLGAGFQHLENSGLLPFMSVRSAMSALEKLYRHVDSVATENAPNNSSATRLVEEPSQNERQGTRTLSESAAKAMLNEAGIATPANHLAQTADEAAAHATRIGFPVVMKVVSAQIAHKTEAGGVRLKVMSERDAHAAFDDIHATVAERRPGAVIDGILVEKMMPQNGREVLVGVHRDDAFGLVLTFGLGGIFVETLKDVAHRVIPVSHDDARRMIREIRAFPLLQGVRGQPRADLEALEVLLVKVSAFASQHAANLHELDLNPVWVGDAGQGAIPLDALIVLNDPSSTDSPIAKGLS